jgi:hypothetical protein
MLASGDDILTLRIFLSMTSLLSQMDSSFSVGQTPQGFIKWRLTKKDDVYASFVKLLRYCMPSSLCTVVCIVYDDLPTTLKIVPDQFLAPIGCPFPQGDSFWAFLSFMPSASLMNYLPRSQTR